MDFTVETTIHIPIEDIIAFYKIDENTPFNDIHDAIEDYVCGMNDCDYYLVNDDIKKRVFKEIIQCLMARMRASGKM